MTDASATRFGLAALRERIGALLGARPDALPIRDWVSVSQGQPARLLGFDVTLLWVMAALLALGTVMVYSASVALPDSPRFARYAPTHFLVRHLLAIGLAAVAVFVTAQIPMSLWEKYSPWLFIGALALLVLVLVPGIGKGVNGARRWIPLGLLNFQPSEWAKLAKERNILLED